MKTAATSMRASRRARGISLVELLVSITIGLVLMIAVVSAYLGSANASRIAEAQGRMYEDAQAALSILSQQIRMAHNNPKQPGYSQATPSNPAFPPGSFAIRGCETTFSDISSAPDLASLTCPASTTTTDSIAIAYEADPNNTIKSTSGKATDCLGQELAVIPTSPDTRTVNAVASFTAPTMSLRTVTFTVADNRFYVGTSSASVNPSLFCKGNGGTNSAAQPLVENVEDLKFTYGTAAHDATSNFVIKGYLPASALETGALPSPGLAAFTAQTVDERWRQVASVRICVVIRSENAVAPDTDSAKYIKCDGTEGTPTDLRLRRAYTTTVVLRNRVSTS